MLPGFYRACYLAMKALFKLVTRWRVRGIENVPNEGPLLIVANHINLTDPILLAVSLDRKVIFMAKKELFSSRFSNFFLRRGLGILPVSRGRMNKEVLRQANQVLADGQVLGMFPEGARSKNTQLQPAFPGSALIALRQGTPILPVGISGTEKIKGITWLLRRPQVTVNIGHPFHPPPIKGKSRKAERTEFTNLMMRHIAELLPPEYRGHYGAQGD